MASIPSSGIRRVFDEAARMRGLGHDVKDLHIGVPDFDTPQHIKEAAKSALDQGLVKYTANAGMLRLREAIAQHIRRNSGPFYSPNTEIIVTVGANEALMLCMLALLDSLDEVLIPEPAWPHARMCTLLAGAVPIAIPLYESEGFQVDPRRVRERLSSRTRMIILNSPHNPTGTILKYENQESLAELATEADLAVVSDEIYDRLVYDGFKPRSFASLPGMRERTLVVNGFSKTYAMTGWRLGWVAGPQELMASLLKVHQYTVTSATSFAQVGGIAALEGQQDEVTHMVEELNKRRLRVLDAVERIPGVTAVRPCGAFYVYANIGGLGLKAESFTSWLLEKYHVAVIPGIVFGDGQDEYIRISYGGSLADVDEAMKRFERACEDLRTH